MPGKKRQGKQGRSKRNTQGSSSGQPARSQPGSGQWWSRYRIPAVLIIGTLLVVGPVVFNDFSAIDDEQFITGSSVVQQADVGRAFTKQLYSPHYKPLVYLSWIAEVRLFGNNPHVLHTNNLLLHLANTLLVFFCLLRITQFWTVTRERAPAIAFFSALLFGIHPMHIESVAWAIERKDVLFSVFYLGGLLSYLKYLQDGEKKKYLYLTAVLYFLSLLSKSMGITLIAMTLLMDFAAGRKDWKRNVLEKWPLIIPFLAALFMYGFVYEPQTGGVSKVPINSDLSVGAVKPPEHIAALPGFYQRVVIAAMRYCFFFFHTIIPAKLAIVYPRYYLLSMPGALVHVALGVIAVIAALPWLFRRYRDLLISGLLFFTIGIIPVLIEEGPGTNFGSDRYTYVPSIGLFLLICTFVLHAFRRHAGKISPGTVMLITYSAILGVAAFRQARLWGNSVDLYSQAIHNYPNNWVALHYRGSAYEEIDPDAAIRDYSESIRLEGTRFRVYFARGTMYLKLKRYQEAIEDLTKTLELNPSFVKAWVNRGNAFRDLGQRDRAIEDYHEALRIDPRFDKALNNRGAAYLHKGMYDAALRDFNTVLENDPTYVNGYINRAALYINPNVREYDKAMQDYESALRLDPQNVQARYYHGWVHQARGNDSAALDDYNQAIAMNTTSGLYYYARAQVLRNLGRHEESIRDARQAQALGYQVPAEYLQ